MHARLMLPLPGVSAQRERGPGIPAIQLIEPEERVRAIGIALQVGGGADAWIVTVAVIATHRHAP